MWSCKEYEMTPTWETYCRCLATTEPAPFMSSWWSQGPTHGIPGYVAVTTLRHWTRPEQVDIVSNMQGSVVPRPWEFYSTATDRVPVERYTSEQNHGGCLESGDYQQHGRGRRNTTSLQLEPSRIRELFKPLPMRSSVLLAPVQSCTAGRETCAARLTQLLQLHRRQEKQEALHQRRKAFVDNQGGEWSRYREEQKSYKGHEEHITLQVVQADLDAQLAIAAAHPDEGPQLISPEWITEQLARTKPTSPLS
eukprot:4832831-Amphidinium_carterae.2